MISSSCGTRTERPGPEGRRAVLELLVVPWARISNEPWGAIGTILLVRIMVVVRETAKARGGNVKQTSYVVPYSQRGIYSAVSGQLLPPLAPHLSAPTANRSSNKVSSRIGRVLEDEEVRRLELPTHFQRPLE